LLPEEVFFGVDISVLRKSGVDGQTGLEAAPTTIQRALPSIDLPAGLARTTPRCPSTPFLVFREKTCK
jgi:hypothetical protein